MDIWGVYEKRVSNGQTRREIAVEKEKYALRNKLPNNPSYQEVIIDGVSQNLVIIDSDNLNEKTIHAMPGEYIEHGSIVEWMDNHWLITELDGNSSLRAKGKMIQCNHLLKWVSEDGIIHEQWCIIEDGTKYLTGEYEDRNFIVTRGDSRIAMTIGRNQDTVQFNRDDRFLIDDADSKLKLAYLLTKPLKVGRTYNGKGVFCFVLQETQATDDDNQELGIANYYKYFPKDVSVGVPVTIDFEKQEQEDTERKNWL